MKPNFKKSILNISATLQKYLGGTSEYSSIKEIDNSLKRKPEKIFFMIFDGMGVYPIMDNLPKDNFLRKNIKTYVTSVFPSTTTNATTTLMSATPPAVHKWLGWSLYMDELKMPIDIYLSRSSRTHEALEDKNYMFNNYPFKAYYNELKSEYNINTVLSFFVSNGVAKTNYPVHNLDEIVDACEDIGKKKGKQFAYCYFGEPDATMHDYGMSSKEAKTVFTNISDSIEKLKKEFPDALFILTCDHGQIDVTEFIDLYKDEALLSFLKRPLSLEVRAASFSVIEGKEKEFKAYFKKTYGKDFKLVSLKMLNSQNYFGQPLDEIGQGFLGDYVAIGKTTNKTLILSPLGDYLKGHHTGTTKYEMTCPVIIL